MAKIWIQGKERFMCPACKNEEIDLGQKYCQICGESLEWEVMMPYWTLKKYEDTGLTPEEIKALNANGKTSEHRWIPVEERLPEDKEDVLVYTKKGWILVAWYGPRGKRWHIVLSDACMIHEDIAAWQPLPGAIPARGVSFSQGITWYPWEHRGPDVQP